MGRKSKELTYDIKTLIVELKRNGHKTCEIVKLLHVPESTIRSVWNKFLKTGNVENVSRPGRPRKISNRGESSLIR